MTSSPITDPACIWYLLDLLSQVPDPRKRRGRRHSLAGLLAVGIAAVIAGSRSFAAIGQWAADSGPDVLAALGADRGPADESTYRRAFALLSADILDLVLGTWLWTRAIQAGGRLVIAVHEDSKGRYGAPRVHAQLAAEGRRHSRKRVARLMRGQGLRGRAARRWKKTTIPDPAAAARADRIRRDFTADASRLNTRWCGTSLTSPPGKGGSTSRP